MRIMRGRRNVRVVTTVAALVLSKVAMTVVVRAREALAGRAQVDPEANVLVDRVVRVQAEALVATSVVKEIVVVLVARAADIAAPSRVVDARRIAGMIGAKSFAARVRPKSRARRW